MVRAGGWERTLGGGPMYGGLTPVWLDQRSVPRELCTALAVAPQRPARSSQLGTSQQAVWTLLV